MPPKPPIRLPTKSAVPAKPKLTPPLPTACATPRSPVQPHTHSKSQLQSQSKPPRPPPPPSRSPTQWHAHPSSRSAARFLIWSGNGVVLICVLLWVRDHYVEIQHVRGTSMAPTLSPLAHETGVEDWVVIKPYGKMGGREGVWKRMFGRGKGGDKDGSGEEREAKGGVQRGDVVTFWKPHKPEEMGIKRVVAIQGDTVYPVRGYAVERKGRALGEGRVRDVMDGLGEDGEEGEGKIVVPYGHVWVEGDNWRKSLDSNDFGPISKSLLMGKAMWVWRSWFGLEKVGDGRNKREEGMRSRVVKGRSEIPAAWVE